MPEKSLYQSMFKKAIEKIKAFVSKISWKVWVMLLVTVPVFFLLLFILSVRYGIFGALPSMDEIAEIQNPVSSSLLDADGALIAEYYIENRTNVEIKDISQYFLDGLIATEDVRFFDHNGIDNRSMMRVVVKSILLMNESSGGGSTLTQQLVKNVFKRGSHGLLSLPVNKVKEMFIARRIEKVYPKEEILKLYVNTVSFGERAFGINTASNRFFNKSPKELTLSESAVLVGILKAPTYYSPRRFPERAELRRNVVLSQMHKYGYLEEETMKKAQSIPLDLKYMSPKAERLIAYVKNHVKIEFEKIKDLFPKEDGTFYNLYTDGLKVYTTLDKQLQREAELIIANTMPDLQKQFFKGWEGSSPFKGSTKVIDDVLVKHPLYIKLKSEGKSQEEILSPFTTAAPRRVWTWEGYVEKNITIIDSIKHCLTLLQSGMMAVNPQTGAIKVWVGGNDFGEFQFDNVSSARQVGSTFKPVTYLVALEQGKDPCEFYPNELMTYAAYDDWTPGNAGKNYGGSYSMQGALAHSVNTVSVQLIMELGPKAVVKKARELGIKSPLPEVPSIVLGTADVSMVEMMEMYSTFANGGRTVEAHIISKIENFKGEVLFEHKIAESRRVIDPDIAQTMVGMLQNGTQFGSGSGIKGYGLPVHIAGKTGTTQNQSDGWFIGFSPNLVAGAWVGTDDRRIHFRSLTTGSGGRTALPMVGKLFHKAYAGKRIAQVHFDTAGVILDCPDFSELAANDMNEWMQQQKERKENEFLQVLENIFTGNEKSEARTEKNDRRRNVDRNATLKERLQNLFKKNSGKNNDFNQE